MSRSRNTRARRVGVAVTAVTLALVTACSANGAGDGEGVAGDGTAPVAAVPAGLVPVDVTVPAALAGQPPFDVPRQALLPPGWTMSVWAKVDEARIAAWTPDGTMLVSRPDAGEVVRLTPAGDGATSAPVLTGLNQPHGLAFRDGRLIVAESDALRSYAYADGRATDPQPIVEGLPDNNTDGDLQGRYSHAVKSVVVGPDGALYFNVGSVDNISAEDREAVDPERATVLRVPPEGGPAETFSRGVRNGTALAVDPDGAVWTAENGRDDLPLPEDVPGLGVRGEVVQAYVDDHPVEKIAKLTPGRDLGWPYCNPDSGPFGGPAQTADLGFVPDAGTNPDGSRLDCAALPPVEQSMGAHSAPLGMEFTELPGLGVGALVGVHGSWNREAPRAPEVSFYPWRDGELGEQQTLVGGFQDPTGERWGRPVATAVGPDGAVYVTDDDAGAVFRAAPPSE